MQDKLNFAFNIVFHIHIIFVLRPIGHCRKLCYYKDMRRLPKQTSAAWHVLSALVPYSDAHTKLSFKPHQFFNDLEKISHKKSASLHAAYIKAQKDGFITLDNHQRPKLSEKGRRLLQPYSPKKMRGTSELMVIFDIPETMRHQRRQFRTYLAELGFRQTQRSVWLSDYDHRDALIAHIAEHKLRDCVDIFEVNRLIR